MTRGQRPTPTALKLLRGNPGRRPLPAHEPKPALGATPPLWLSPAARLVWDREAPRLVALGLLSEIDAQAFGCLCSLLVRLERQARLDPETGLSDQVDPRLSSELRQVWGLFGMAGPVSRARMSAEKPQGKLEGFLSGKTG